MNLKQLSFAVRVAETHSFSKAAELCFATQPTLSNAISQLEDELGGRLFNRTTRKVSLTPFGEAMLPRIQEILQSRDELLDAAHAWHNPSHKLLRIGFSPLVDMERLNRVLTPFREAHPEVSIFFKECFLDEMSQRLTLEQIDLQIRPLHPARDGEQAYLFYIDNLFYLPAQGTQQAPRRLGYTLDELPDTPVILTGGGCGLNDAVKTLFSQQKRSLTTYPGHAMSYGLIENWASLGIGAGILPAACISPDNSDRYPLFIEKGQPATIAFQWVWCDDRYLPEHLKLFIEYIHHHSDLTAATAEK